MPPGLCYGKIFFSLKAVGQARGSPTKWPNGDVQASLSRFSNLRKKC